MPHCLDQMIKICLRDDDDNDDDDDDPAFMQSTMQVCILTMIILTSKIIKRLFYNDCSRVRDLGSLLRKFMAPGGVVRSN